MNHQWRHVHKELTCKSNKYKIQCRKFNSNADYMNSASEKLGSLQTHTWLSECLAMSAVHVGACQCLQCVSDGYSGCFCLFVTAKVKLKHFFGANWRETHKWAWWPRFFLPCLPLAHPICHCCFNPPAVYAHTHALTAIFNSKKCVWDEVMLSSLINTVPLPMRGLTAAVCCPLADTVVTTY